jgi:hypothetical protein
MLPGVHLLPSTGEFTYDTVAYSGQRLGGSLGPINTYAGGGAISDYSIAIDQLQAAHPECTTVSVVCAWFCDGLTAGSCHVYPSTTYIGGIFQPSAGGSDEWRCSGLNQGSGGLIAIPTNSAGSFIYGGTPSDQSIVRCIRDLKSRGLRVVFYPFLLMTAAGEPWRGQITFSPDISSAATSAVGAFLGPAATTQFTPDFTNLTVAYSGSATDFTFRRMILHYANLCVVAGGVNLFVLGSELRGLETIRGPAWTPAGTTDGGGHAIWDYPFVAGLVQLASDVRSVFTAAGLAKNTTALQNLIAYSADWSDWMGFQHPGANGQWPHLDSLWASTNIDFVSFDNYLPLSDWTTADSQLDAQLWQIAAPTSWPPANGSVGLGLSGAPTIYSEAYLKANIEGGEKFNWFYNDAVNGGAAFDPNGSGLVVSQPQGDRATQTREIYYAGQQILANKQLRWWWNNSHQAVYETTGGWVPRGPATEWVAQSKPIVFLEYGFPSVDKATNQPNVFYSPASVESGTPFWSIWNPQPGGGFVPQRDDTIAGLALNAVYQYWITDTPSHNATSGAGVAMVQFAFCCVWNWDARPFPTFPLLASVWGDAADWPFGDWQSPYRALAPPVAPAPDPTPGAFPDFPPITTMAWPVVTRAKTSTDLADHVSGRSLRAQKRAYGLYEFELTFNVLRADSHAELQAIAGFYDNVGGADGLFWFAPPNFGVMSGQALGSGNGSQTGFSLVRSIGAYSEPVQGAAVTAVYLNGLFQATGWSVSSGYAPILTFLTPPAAGVAVSADFSSLWLCRFAEDVADFENFMTLLWRLGTVKMETVRP